MAEKGKKKKVSLTLPGTKEALRMGEIIRKINCLIFDAFIENCDCQACRDLRAMAKDFRDIVLR